MKNMREKIARFGCLCNKGSERGLTQEENKEFKKLEKSITDAMMKDEVSFDKYIQSFKKATESLAKLGVDLAGDLVDTFSKRRRSLKWQKKF